MKMYSKLRRTSFALSFAAVVASTAIHAADDPLNSWARRPVIGLTTNLLSVTYGNGLFVAVGDGSTVATSPDGVSWTYGSIGAYGRLKRVRYINNQFIAIGETDKILFSSNATTWTVGTLPTPNSWDIAYDSGRYVVVGDNTYFSSNAVNWTLTTGGALFDAVAFGNGRFVSYRLGTVFPGSTATYYSTNGTSWLPGGAGPNSGSVGGSGGGVGDLLFANGVFVGASSLQQNSILTSSDGVTWSYYAVSGIIPTVSGGLAFGQGTFVWAVYDSFANLTLPRIYTATDGISWQQRTLAGAGDPALNGKPRDGTFGAGSFVFVGDAGYIIQSGNSSGVPLITVQPQDRAAVVDNPVTFNAQAVGEPPLAYQWYFNSNAISGATSNNYFIAHVQATNTGAYHVVITNSFGSVTSRVAQLGVSFLDISRYAGIKILGVPGKTYRIEATPTAPPLNWQTVTNIILPASPYIWIDYASPQVGQRLYRAAELQ